MATNFFFNNFKSSQEQLLIENLIIEAIRIYGEDMYYIPRRIGNYDALYTADDQSIYDQSFIVEIYIKSVDGFAGDGNFMSKFGLEIRDQVVFSIAQRVFSQEIGTYTNAIRPHEGDLIYFPLNKKCFQIKYVNKFEMFYQLGGLQTWEMTCELFEYSDEVIDTGIPEIDVMQKRESTNILDYIFKDEYDTPLTDEEDNYLVTEQYNLGTILGTSNNEDIQSEAAEVNVSSGLSGFIDFTQINPFSERQT
jgi:hypothetical protein